MTAVTRPAAAGEQATLPGSVGAPTRVGSRWSNPVRLWAALVVAALAALGAAGAAADSVAGRQTAAQNAVHADAPLVEYVEELSFALADANAAAATGVLVGPAPPARFAQRYGSDIQEAEQSLDRASSMVAGDPVSAVDLDTVAADLTVYTGLIGTADANNRLGYPVGAAYLREASNLLTGTMLKDVQDVVTRQSAAQQSASSTASRLPYLLIAAVLIAAVALYWSARTLARITRRTVNLGLAACAVALLVLLVWPVAAEQAASASLSSAQTQFTRVRQLLDARSNLAVAESDQALSLISRGEDDGSYQRAASAALASIRPATSGESALTGPFTALDTAARKAGALTTAGQYAQAVGDVVGYGATAGAGTVLATAQTLDTQLSRTIDTDQAAYGTAGTAAVSDLGYGVPAALLLGLIGAACAAIGVNRRLEEYR
jgi:hypothetical protein